MKDQIRFQNFKKHSLNLIVIKNHLPHLWVQVVNRQGADPPALMSVIERH